MNVILEQNLFFPRIVQLKKPCSRRSFSLVRNWWSLYVEGNK